MSPKGIQPGQKSEMVRYASSRTSSLKTNLLIPATTNYPEGPTLLEVREIAAITFDQCVLRKSL